VYLRDLLIPKAERHLFRKERKVKAGKIWTGKEIKVLKGQERKGNERTGTENIVREKRTEEE
jgi:hypothetical protein